MAPHFKPNVVQTPVQQPQYIGNPMNGYIEQQQAHVQNTLNNMPVENIIPYPAGYNTMTPYNKSLIIENIIAQSGGSINPVHDPLPNADLSQKMANLQSYITFIQGAHRGDNALSKIQIDALLDFVMSSTLRAKMSQYGCVSKPSQPELVEVPISDYSMFNQDGKYDFAFTMETNNKKKKLVIMYCSVPEYNTQLKCWQTKMEFQMVNK